MSEDNSMSSVTTATVREAFCSSLEPIFFERGLQPEAHHFGIWVSPNETGEFQSKSEKHESAPDGHGSTYYQAFSDALVTGLCNSAGSGVTFGFIRPSVEVLMRNILGQGPRRNLFEEDLVSKAMMMIAAIVAGFALGFSHTVVSQTFSNYLGQYTGYTSFEFKHEGENTRSQRPLNFFIDVFSHDVIAMICFGMAGAARSALFHGTGVSPVISVMLSASLGGFLTGTLQYFAKSAQKGSFSLKRHEKLPVREYRTFFSVLETELGAMIRNEDLCVWFTQFVGKIFAGTICRPMAIVAGDLVDRKARSGGIPGRESATLQGLTSYLVFLAVWFITLRVSDSSATRYISSTYGDTSST